MAKENSDKITPEEYNKFKELTKTIVNLFHKEDFTPFEAFIVLEGVKQNITSDLIFRTTHQVSTEIVKEEIAKDKISNEFYEGKVSGPYQ